jgi:hypothetical protein
VLGIDADALDRKWAVAKATGELLKFGGGFYVGKLPRPRPGDSVPSASEILGEAPRPIYGGYDSLGLPSGLEDSEKMLLFPESVIKGAVPTAGTSHSHFPLALPTRTCFGEAHTAAWQGLLRGRRALSLRSPCLTALLALSLAGRRAEGGGHRRLQV